MLEHLEYFKTTDNKLFTYAKEALMHEVETNNRVMNFKIIGYDKHCDEHNNKIHELNKDFTNLVSLAEGIYHKTYYIYISNQDAYNFIINLAYLIQDDEYKTAILESHKDSFEGANWYEIHGRYEFKSLYKKLVT